MDVHKDVLTIARERRHDALEHAFTGELYIPIRQTSDYMAVNLVVRTGLSERQLAASVRSALESTAPDAARNQWLPLQQLIDKVASPRRFVVFLLGGFAAFGLLLAALGIYALISYGVRTDSATCYPSIPLTQSRHKRYGVDLGTTFTRSHQPINRADFLLRRSVWRRPAEGQLAPVRTRAQPARS